MSSTARETAALASVAAAPNGSAAHPSSQKLRELYYQYFHKAHPILPPSTYLKTNPGYILSDVIVAVVNYIGAAYIDHANLDFWKHAVDDALNAHTLRRDGQTVQALVLLAVAQNVQDEPEAAYEYLNRAIDVALEIGMQREGFAKEQGRGEWVLEEGWRRTWWEMYYVDAFFAAVSQKPGFRLFEVEAWVGLPSEEGDYDECRVSAIYTICFDGRSIDEENGGDCS